MSNRVSDLSINRPKLKFDSAFERYWAEHAPTHQDLAELFGISARRVRELQAEGWLTKGGSLARSISEYTTYRVEVLGSAGHVGGRPRRGW